MITAKREKIRRLWAIGRRLLHDEMDEIYG